MATPNLQPQQLFSPPNTLPMPSSTALSSGSISLLGLTLSRTQLYIIGAILLVLVGYFLWRWYKSREQFESDEDSDDQKEDVSE